MKRCSRCKVAKPEAEFGKHNGRKDGLQSFCTECSKARAKVYYEANAEVMRKQIYSSRKSRNQELRGWLTQLKRELGCTFCSETEPVALDFHHNQGDKDFVIGRFRSYSKPQVIKEILKCLLVCSNCHRKIHAGLIDGSGVSSDWSRTSLIGIQA
jgi:hypothetical protein